MTAPELILQILSFAPKPLAVHEIRERANEMGYFYNENHLASRCSDLASEKVGKIKGEYLKGEHFKRWSLIRSEKSGQLLLENVA